MSLRVLLLLTFTLTLTWGQVTRRGACPAVTVKQDFNITAYLGLWYDLQHYPAEYQDGDCATAYYASIPSSNKVNVTNIMYSRIRPNETITQIGEAERLTGNDGKLRVTFKLPNGVTSTSDYWVLASDYNSYSVVWTCFETRSTDNSLIMNSQTTWILSRTKELGDDSWTAVKKTLKDNGISTVYLTSVDKHECAKDGAADLVPYLGTLVAALYLALSGRMS